MVNFNRLKKIIKIYILLYIAIVLLFTAVYIVGNRVDITFRAWVFTLMLVLFVVSSCMIILRIFIFFIDKNKKMILPTLICIVIIAFNFLLVFMYGMFKSEESITYLDEKK